MSRLDQLYIGTNTKMYKTIADTVDFLTCLHQLTDGISRKDMELFVIPSFTALDTARKCVPPQSIKLGAQNMAWEDEGQFTGEISPRMLKEVGVEIVEIGHSERRHVLRETDEEENKKVLCALRHGFTPLLCVGETAAQKQQDIADEVLSTQLKIGLGGVTPEQAKNLWVAYEPVWAIGVSGVPASKEYADEKHSVIKAALCHLFGDAIGGDVPVLYGGSVNDENTLGLIAMPHIDGLFIGRGAWQAQRFNALIRRALPEFLRRKANQ